MAIIMANLCLPSICAMVCSIPAFLPGSLLAASVLPEASFSRGDFAVACFCGSCLLRPLCHPGVLFAHWRVGPGLLGWACPCFCCYPGPSFLDSSFSTPPAGPLSGLQGTSMTGLSWMCLHHRAGDAPGIVYTIEACAESRCIYTQGPELHLEMVGQQEPVLLLDVSTLQGVSCT